MDLGFGASPRGDHAHTCLRFLRGFTPRGLMQRGFTARGFMALLVVAGLTACSPDFALEGIERVDADPTSVPVTVEPTPTPQPNLGLVIDTPDAVNGSVLISPAAGEGQYLFNVDGNISRIWEGTGVAGSVEILPSRLLLRTVPTAAVDVERATGSALMADRSGTIWSCTLNESWFGGLHLTDQAIWLPPDQLRGTEPWGSILLAAVQHNSADSVPGAPDDDRFSPVLIEVIPPLADGDLTSAGGLLRSGDCGEFRVLWKLADHFDELDEPDRIAATDATSAGIASLAWNPDGRAVAATIGGLDEVWVLDGMAAFADDSGATVLRRWDARPSPSGVAWDGDDLLVVADSTVVVVDVVTDRTRPMLWAEVYGDASIQVLSDGVLVLAEHDSGTITQHDSEGEIIWEFRNPVAGQVGSPDDVLDADADQRPAIESATFYRSDFPGLG